jgi:hypothetical protein
MEGSKDWRVEYVERFEFSRLSSMWIVQGVLDNSRIVELPMKPKPPVTRIFIIKEL